MFSDNDKISLRQLKRLLIFDLFSISGIIIPSVASAKAGKDGILSIILATLFAFVYAWIILSFAKRTGGKFLDYSDSNGGKVLTFVIGLFYVMKLFACCVFAVRLFGEVIGETLLKETDPRIILLLLLIVSAYAASKGFEVRARITEVLFFIVIVPIFIFLLVGLNKVELSNLMPLLTQSAGTIALGGYEVFLTFSVLEFLLFTAPLIQFKKADISQGKRLYRYVAQALIVTGIMNLLLFILTTGILGQSETRQKLWSMVTVIQVINLPGGFIRRQDALVLGFWMLSIFTIISAFFYYMSYISKHIFRISGQNYLLVPYILLIFGASVIPMDTEQFYFYFENYMKYIGMPQSILLPLIILIIGGLRKVKVKTAVKSLLLLFSFTTALTLTGCGDMAEIEDRNFIQALGIDITADDKISAYYVLPDLKALTEQGADDPKKLLLHLEGLDYWEIEEQYSLENNKRLDFSHLKMIVLGRSIAEDKELLAEFLSYAENKYELGRNTLVFLSDSSAKDIITISGDLEGGVGDYLEKLYKINLINTGIAEVTIGNLVLAKNEGDLTVNVPLIKAIDKKVELAGIGIFEDNILTHVSNQKDSDYIDIANGYGKNKVIFLTKEGNENVTEHVVKLNNITRSMDFYSKDGKPYLVIGIEGIGFVEKGIKDFATISDRANVQKMEEIQNRLNALIAERTEKTIEVLMREKQIDFMNLYRMTSYKDKKIWLKYRENPKAFIENLQYSVEVSIKLE
ncbi:hypothetical protein acsn021_23780 [Anaerocolumna cellulosilytica]|uniref:Germination protein n=1 Tax=Anaerocolumna cellulosilytica TaxID=433286 RepID=A0A6S6R0H1_9FIRM|nr:endospore germination permease [Anaerocolumna cellulosilytica]MBB5193977.1 spore germination protein (amino acid permease)/Ger(x)C family germination protein [Anaerocolumna cellulosilytica]BCJ94809.1 hypothetical protein acsn021_23780 [Anaerocolumna cellulosilytica]